MSAISSACSPVSGWETSSASVSTPSFLAYSGSSACSASMNAAMPPAALGVGHRVQGDRRLAGGLRAVDLHDPAARQAADAERDVEGDRAGRDDLDRRADLVAEAHDRALAELLLDLGERGVERLLAVVSCHGSPLEGCGLNTVARKVRGATDIFGRARHERRHAFNIAERLFDRSPNGITCSLGAQGGVSGVIQATQARTQATAKPTASHSKQQQAPHRRRRAPSRKRHSWEFRRTCCHRADLGVILKAKDLEVP